MKIKSKLLNSFVWPSFTRDILKPPKSFFSDKNDARMAMHYYERAFTLVPSAVRASVVAVRMMIANHQTQRALHAAH